MKLTFTIILAMAAGLEFSQATSYRGTISGQITSIQNATFLMFSSNAPLVVGDPITGLYLYDSPNVDTAGFASPTFSITVGSVHFGGAPLVFTVADGVLTQFVYVLDSSSFPGVPGYASHISMSTSTLSIGELIGTEPAHRVSASLTFGAPARVPEAVITGSLLVIGLISLWRFHS